MFPFALDVLPLPLWSSPVIAYRREAIDPPRDHWLGLRLAIRYEAGNALTTAPNVSSASGDSLAEFRPRTELGKRLLALRQAYVASGGRLMSPPALDDDLHDRRGGVGDG